MRDTDSLLGEVRAAFLERSETTLTDPKRGRTRPAGQFDAVIEARIRNAVDDVDRIEALIPGFTPDGGAELAGRLRALRIHLEAVAAVGGQLQIGR